MKAVLSSAPLFAIAICAGCLFPQISAAQPEPSSPVPTAKPGLPDALRFADGAPVLSREDWGRRRVEIANAVLVPEYGPMPPVPSAVKYEDVGGNWPRRIPGAVPCCYVTGLVRVLGGIKPFDFRIDLLVPPGTGPFPVVLTGDGCYRFQERDMADAVLHRGMVYAQFNRCEIARDRADAPDAGARSAFPGGYGTLAFWAWGYHRAIDALLTFPFVDGSKIAVTGLSRGGKAALLAAATDLRIALVADSGSGCGGAGSFRIRGEGCERIADITAKFPHWFAPSFADWANREDEMPFDQNFLKALIAPRPLLTLGGRDDIWANPLGILAIHKSMRPVWRLLGDESALAVSFRDGGHGYRLDDWARFLDFVTWRFLGGERPVLDGRAVREEDASPQ